MQQRQALPTLQPLPTPLPLQQQQQSLVLVQEQESNNLALKTSSSSLHNAEEETERSKKRRNLNQQQQEQQSLSNASSRDAEEEDNEDEEEEESNEEVEKSDKKHGPSKPGNKRIRITFESFGTKGKIPQTFGKPKDAAKKFIPDGLRGTHIAYDEAWRFETVHGTQEILSGLVKITWSVTNLTTMKCTSLTETPSEALERITSGNTISNKVFRLAMKQRMQDLESDLVALQKAKSEQTEEMIEFKCANLRTRIRTLSPKHFKQGLLLFGLLHDIVQNTLSQTPTEDKKEANGSNTLS